MSTALEPRYHAGHLLDILLKHGGHVITFDTAFDSFADASGTSAPCDVISIAAFLFEKSKSARLDSDWCVLLDPFLGHLPPDKRFFHMTTFMAKNRPYDRLDDGDWLALRHDLIESASRNLEFAIVSSISVAEYNAMLSIGDTDPAVDKRATRRDILGGPFTTCGIWSMRSLASYIERKEKTGNIAFFFEAGDPDQAELCARINDIAKSSFLSDRYRYGGHAFVPKQYHHALGAADMLAWEYRRGIEKYLQDGSFHPGPFFSQLFHMPIGGIHFSPANLQMQTMAMAVEESNRWGEEQEKYRLEIERGREEESRLEEIIREDEESNGN